MTCLALLLIASGAGLAADPDLSTPVRIGTGLIEGVTCEAGDVVAFKGIPYAAAPVGDLRWREPQPALMWEGVRKADRFGASCPQPITSGNPYTAEFKITGEMNEDCLFLNLWAPNTPSAGQRAVMVYIHGGSGTRGSGSVPLYDGEALARKGIIVVTVNFRLGIFGGMGHPELTTESPYQTCGNYGMLDLIAALRWVRANIAAFGGDPDKVTLCGQSSGSMALHYLMASPLTTGLFRGAIAVSFPYDYLLGKNTLGDVAQKEREGLKFAAAKNTATVGELRNIPAADLIAPDPAVGTFTRNCLSGSNCIDGRVVPLCYAEALESGRVADVPVLTGITMDDFGPPADFMNTNLEMFVFELPGMFGVKAKEFPSVLKTYLEECPATNDLEARRMMKRAQVEYRTASVFDWARRRTVSAKSPTFTYLFGQAVPWPEHPEFGAFHSSDLIYAFNNLDKMNRPWTDDDRRVADEVSSYWVNFVKAGDPNHAGLPVWDSITPDRPATMLLGASSGPREIAPPSRLQIYLDLLTEKQPGKSVQK